MAYIVSIISGKGGCGKSTLTINLARAMVLQGRSVRVLDADPQETTLEWFVLSEGAGGGFQVLPAQSKAELRKAVIEAETDYVLIDGSGRADEHLLAAASVSDLCILPVSGGIPDAWATRDTLEVLDPLRKAQGGNPYAVVLMNRVRRNTNVFKALKRYFDVRSIPQMPVFIGDRTSIAQAVALGKTVFDQDKKDATACIEFKAVAKQIRRFFND